MAVVWATYNEVQLRWKKRPEKNSRLKTLKEKKVELQVVAGNYEKRRKKI